MSVYERKTHHAYLGLSLQRNSMKKSKRIAPDPNAVQDGDQADAIEQ
jgi:hypothetical protein